MTHEECKIAVCKLLEESELNTIIDHLIISEGVGMMLDSPQIEDFVPRAILAVAIRKEYERFRPLSETGVSIEENICKWMEIQSFNK